MSDQGQERYQEVPANIRTPEQVRKWFPTYQIGEDGVVHQIECENCESLASKLTEAREALEEIADVTGTSTLQHKIARQALSPDTTEAEGSPCASDVPTEPS